MSPSPSHRRPCDCTEKVSDCTEVKYVGLQLQAHLVCAAPGLSAERPNQATIGPDTATVANDESKTSEQESPRVAGWQCEKCVRPRRCAAVPEIRSTARSLGRRQLQTMHRGCADELKSNRWGIQVKPSCHAAGGGAWRGCGSVGWSAGGGYSRPRAG
jgi:hypothetical protein